MSSSVRCFSIPAACDFIFTVVSREFMNMVKICSLYGHTGSADEVHICALPLE